MECEEKVEKILDIIEKVANREYERDNWRGILDNVAELFEADGAAIGEFRGDYIYYTKVSSSIAEYFPDYDPEEFKVPLWRSAAKEILKKKVLIVNDYQNYEKAVESWKRVGLKTLLVVSLGEREPVGTIALGRFSSYEPFTEEDGRILSGLAFIFSFIIKEELEKRELMEKAIKDYLTKLYNRLYLEEEGIREIERAKRYDYPLSLIMFDLDDFKVVNDFYGHDKGDRVLIKFADILRSEIRSTDIPVRYGGEEFVVLLPHTSMEEAFFVAERIRKKFEKILFRFNSEVIRITVSGGIAVCEPGEDCSLEKLLFKADKAMYEAKARGKNRVEMFSCKV